MAENPGQNKKFCDVIIRAPDGTRLTGKSWLTEAHMRMLMSNLDPEVAENTKDIVTDQISAHDLIRGYLPAGWSVENWKPAQRVSKMHEQLVTDASLSCAMPVQAMLDFQQMGSAVIDYGNNIWQVAFNAGVSNVFNFPGYEPCTKGAYCYRPRST